MLARFMDIIIDIPRAPVLRRVRVLWSLPILIVKFYYVFDHLSGCGYVRFCKRLFSMFLLYYSELPILIYPILDDLFIIHIPLLLLLLLLCVLWEIYYTFVCW